MKKAYLKIWALLVVSLLLFVALSMFGRFEIAGHQIATAHFPAVQKVAETVRRPSSVRPAAQAKAETVVQADTLPKTILLIGDSMIEGLSPRFAAYAKANGHTLYSVIWYGSTTEKWAESRRLAALVEKYSPDYVVVCIGGNELFIRNIVSRRAKFVDEIVSEIGDLPFVWVGPPNWKEDTGINDLLRAKVGDGRFYLSKHLKLARASDGAHPTRQAAMVWMDSIADWIVGSSANPIKLNRPSAATGKPARTIVYTPDD